MSTLPDQSKLEQAGKINVLDSRGRAHCLGTLIKDQKVALLFIRHFWCGNCQAYLDQLSRAIPPCNLPKGTCIVVIGCGAPKLVEPYAELVKCPYPIYTNPTLELYKLFGFVQTLNTSKAGVPPKEYEKDMGSTWTRTISTLKAGFGKLGSPLSMGPKDQNGGEMVIEPDGNCSFFHRMQHTADHVDIPDIAKALGVVYTPVSAQLHSVVKCETGVKNGGEIECGKDGSVSADSNVPTSCELGRV